MNIQSFMQKFADTVEDDSIVSLPVETKFRELDSWDSLAALSIMAMIDEEFAVNLTAIEMKTTETFEELATLIKSKQ